MWSGYPDRGGFAVGVFVAQPKRRNSPGLLEPGKSDSLAFALARSRVRPRLETFAEVDGGFFKHTVAASTATTKPRSETTITAHEGFLYLNQFLHPNQTALQLRRLNRNQLFDTL
ncbi:hypothetical protein [Mycolicibacterium doricum]|uniref:hypothetical protein n=1 Tax=Mycolicibacterium doricum TaxID=126673 RepID=UPI0013D1CB55|nr:hypothetical protein [Mycolicibacterium doricum]MCV7267916.1 hypothetical protein [Mycolicibacterium doricum]